MKSESYITIQGWMINEMGLKSTELLVFAIIYGYSKDNQGKFDGSLNYLCSSTNSSKNTIINCLNLLLEKEYILKETLVINNITFCKYSQNEQVVQKMVWGGAKIDMVGGAKIEPNNTINNNTKENKEVFFKDSIYYDYFKLREVLAKDEKFKKDYPGVDLKNYIEDCDTWSETKKVKRTNRGWLMTIRKFIKEAKQNNKLVLLKDFKEKKGGHTNH